MRLRFAASAALLLSITPAALAEDLSFDRLKLTLPAGWTSKAAGAGVKEHRRLIPGGDLTGKAEVVLFRAFDHTKQPLDQLATGLLNRIDRGRKPTAGSKAKVSTTAEKLRIGHCGRTSTDAAGTVRYGTVFVFEIGADRAQALYLGAADLEAFKQASAALAPSLDRAVVIAAPTPGAPPAAPAPTARFDRLSFVRPPKWTQRLVEADGKRYVILSPDGAEDARVYLYGSFEPKGQPLTTLAQRILDMSDAKREVTERGTGKTIRNASGLTLAVDQQTSKSAAASRQAAVYLFQVGDRVQAVYLVAASGTRFHAVRRPLERALKDAKAIGAASPRPETDPSTPPPVARDPKRSGPGANAFADQGVLGSTSVVSVPGSAKLTPVPHRVAWLQPQPLSPSASDAQYGTDRFGDVLWVVADKLVSRHRPHEHAVHGYLKRAHTLRTTAATLTSVKTLLQTKLENPPKHGWEPSYFKSLATDRDGHLYLHTKLLRSDFPVITHYRWDTKRMEIVASPHYLARVCRAAKLHAYVNARWAFHPDPRGGRGWLFLWDSFGKTYVIQHLKRTGEGAWNATPVQPRFKDATTYGLPTKSAIVHGCADWKGGWVFYTGNALWRLLPSGQSWPLAVFKLGSKSVWIPRPAVLENGDVWFAINRRYDITAHTDALDRTHVFALVGDRSRWVRVRLDGKGGIALGEIDGKVLLASLKAAGATIKSNLVKTLLPVADPKSGGVLAYDTRHELFYVIQPTD